MRAILSLALASLSARRLTAALAVLSIAVSAALLISVERLRLAAKASFAGAVSDVDMVVGARSGGAQLMLYTVFHLGDAVNNIRWETYQQIAANRDVKWIAPISLGDSHRGYRVVGTTEVYFEKLRYRGGRPLAFAEGRAFADLYETVLGAEVAEALGYQLGDKVVIAHGIGGAGFAEHENKPFAVAGILARTGTPVDKSVYVGLEAIEAIHVDWRTGAPPRPGAEISAEAARAMDLTPRAVTAALVGLKSKIAVFRFQRWVNEHPGEPLTAVVPGFALTELWGLIGVAEAALLGVSALVAAAALLGMITMLLASLEERRREIAILRSVGARPRIVFALLAAEAGAIGLLGAALGLGLHLAMAALAGPALETAYGVDLALAPLDLRVLWLIGAFGVGGALCGVIPGLRAYSLSLSDGIGLKT